MSKFYAIKVLQKRKPAHYLCIEDGEPLVVASQLGCQVFVESKPFEWYHPSKLIPADKADTGVEKQRQA